MIFENDQCRPLFRVGKGIAEGPFVEKDLARMLPGEILRGNFQPVAELATEGFLETFRRVRHEVIPLRLVAVSTEVGAAWQER
jgi:hypothetical protein